MNSRRNDGRRIAGWATWMLAACVVGVGFASCDSPTAETSKKAAQDANKAARITASAGEVRATDAFMNEMAGKDVDAAKAAGQQIVDQIKKDGAPNGPAFRKYFSQQSVGDDLKKAAGMLTEALRLPEFNDESLKASLQAQLGGTAAQESQARMMELEGKLNQMASLMLDLDQSATHIASLGAEADMQESLAKSVPVVDPGPFQAALDEAKTKTAAAQAAVDGLQQQIDTKKAAAAKIYAATDAEFQSVETIKGSAALVPGRKALEARKEGDQLMADVVNLQPALESAQADLVAAKIQQTQAEARLKAATGGRDDSDAISKAARDRAAALRQEASQLIDGDNGLAAQYKSFTDLAAQIQKNVDSAAATAGTAEKAWASTLSAFSARSNKLADMKLDPSDPLLRAANSADSRALLQLNQAAAQEQLGRAYLMGYTAEQLGAMADSSMAIARQAAGMPAEPAAAPSAANDAEKAKKEFDVANETAKRAGNGGSSAGSPVHWLALTLQAVALNGMVSAGDTSKIEPARKAARDAETFNPFLNLNALANDNATPAQ